jgi:hypothetical protein
MAIELFDRLRRHERQATWNPTRRSGIVSDLDFVGTIVVGMWTSRGGGQDALHMLCLIFCKNYYFKTCKNNCMHQMKPSINISI